MKSARDHRHDKLKYREFKKKFKKKAKPSKAEHSHFGPFQPGLADGLNLQLDLPVSGKLKLNENILGMTFDAFYEGHGWYTISPTSYDPFTDSFDISSIGLDIFKEDGSWNFFTSTGREYGNLNEMFHRNKLKVSTSVFRFPPGDDLDQKGPVFRENIVGTVLEYKVGNKFESFQVVRYEGSSVHLIENQQTSQQFSTNLHTAFCNKRVRFNFSRHVTVHILQFLQSRLIAARSMPTAANG